MSAMSQLFFVPMVQPSAERSPGGASTDAYVF